jgi:hypothetical protein
MGTLKSWKSVKIDPFLKGDVKKNPSTHITQVKLKADQQHQQESNMLKEEEESMQNPSTTRSKLKR